MSYDKYRKEAAAYAGEAPWTISLFFKKFWIPLFLLGLATGGIMYFTNIASQPARVLQKTLDADNMVYNYEWFKQTYEDVLATDVKIKNTRASLEDYAGLSRKDMDMFDKNESGRLKAVLLGLQNHKESIMAQYNARSKMANRSLFKTDLPKQLK